LPVQSPHRLPLLPQATFKVPVWQVPPVDAEQQPPLHGVLLSQAAPQLCVVVLHAWLAGQSLALVQPQALAPPKSRQALPAGLPTQLPHDACPSAHAAEAVPVAQLVPSQQPPLHGWLALHDIVQASCRYHSWCRTTGPSDSRSDRRSCCRRRR
jgi:hypothetical protein